MRCGCRLSFSLVWAVVDLSVGEMGGSRCVDYCIKGSPVYESVHCVKPSTH